MIEPTADRPEMPPLGERVLGDVLRRQAAAMPQASAVEFPAHGVGFTYEELLDQALRVAGFLQRLGLMPGDRVAIMLANSPQWVLAWYGSLLAGMVDVGINPEASGAILVHQLSVAGVKAVVCGSPSYSAVLDATEKVPGVRAIILVDSETDHSATTSTYGFEELLRGSVASKVEVDPRSIASVRFTSGTTGPAKAVAVTHSQASVFNAHIIWDMEYRPGDRLYTCFALFHNQASINGVAASIPAGGWCIVDHRFRASGD